MTPPRARPTLRVDDPLAPQRRLGLAPRAERERALAGADSPIRPDSATRGGSFFVAVKTLADTPMSIHTDLLTPLGAYLRLREGARASFLLESVERGRLCLLYTSPSPRDS